jgi:hypothetical protein
LIRLTSRSWTALTPTPLPRPARGCDPEAVLYGDLAPEAARQAAAGLGPQSLSSLRQPLTAAAWHHIPSTYVDGAHDAAVPPALTSKFTARAGKTTVLDSDHSAVFSHPAELARVLEGELRSD